jgi:hypothetical protein
VLAGLVADAAVDFHMAIDDDQADDNLVERPIIHLLDGKSVVDAVAKFGRLTPRQQFQRAEFSLLRAIKHYQAGRDHEYSLQWVQSHSSIKFNEQADVLAKLGAGGKHQSHLQDARLHWDPDNVLDDVIQMHSPTV